MELRIVLAGGYLPGAHDYDSLVYNTTVVVFALMGTRNTPQAHYSGGHINTMVSLKGLVLYRNCSITAGHDKIIVSAFK